MPTPRVTPLLLCVAAFLEHLEGGDQASKPGLSGVWQILNTKPDVTTIISTYQATGRMHFFKLDLFRVELV